MENLTIIIPIHEYNSEIDAYLNKAIESVTKQGMKLNDILIVGPTNVIDSVKDKEVQLLVNDGNIDYCSQINLAVQSINTKYFSILGFDDVYSPTWFQNVDKYIEHMPEFSIFMPIVNYIDKDENIVGTVNEIIWAMSFSNEIGIIDENTLQAYYDFSPNGGVFRRDDFIEIGMLKPSIKLSFWYEFLLRATNQGLKIYVIPRNGYYQKVDREGSMISVYDKEMDQDERTWWINLAGKEYYFKQERKKSYKYTPDKKLSEIDGLK